MALENGGINKGIEVDIGNIESDSINPDNALQKLDDRIEPKLTNEELSHITNREFLKIPKKERLQYVTNGNISYENIINGKTKTLSFFFDHNGTQKDDTDLFRKTTIGQLMGEEVCLIMCNGIEYIRTGLDGEFFNGNKRLKIYTNTEIEITKIRNKEELDHLNEVTVIDLEKYYDSPDNSDIIYGGFRRGINILAFCDVFEKILSNLSGKERDIRLEELFTEVDRKRSRGDLDSHSDELKKLITDDNDDGMIDTDKLEWNDIELVDIGGGEKGLLELISVAEGSNGNYNSLFNNADQSEIDFTSMTLKEILVFQKDYTDNGSFSSAIGKYHFIRETLEHMINKYNFSLDQKFSPEFQDRIAYLKIQEAGLDKFKGNDLPINDFQYNLAGTWASFPKDDSGISRYANDGVNHARISSGDLKNQLYKIIA